VKEKVRALVTVFGRVQGVFFRMETQRAAERYGVQGWVRNRRDGTVESEMEGDASAVHALVAWCRKGPPHASVDRVDVVWEPYVGESEDFGIRY
jgi:acylphosphatase